MEAELELLAEKRSQMILEDEKAKGEIGVRLQIFEQEELKPENTKVEGQTVRVGMEDIMKYNGINFGQFRVGDIQGGRCRKVMSFGEEIPKSMTEFLQSIP